MPRLPSLTSLRWFAASLVFVSHAESLLKGTPWEARLDTISTAGAAGVSFFFVLSGFVLAWSDRLLPVREFYRRAMHESYRTTWSLRASESPST